MTGSPETITYDDVARSYRENLVTRLRGFRAGPEFLDAWVDEEDTVQSLLYMFEAARAHGLPRLRVVLSAETAARIDRDALLRGVARLGSVVASDDTSLDVRFEAATTSPVEVLAPERVTSRETAHLENRTPEAPRDDAFAWTIDAVYERAVATGASDRTHEGRPDLAGVQVFATATVDNVTLRASIDPSDHRVCEARYEGASGDVQRSLLQALCGALEGVSLREGSDHAVIRLEHALRDRSLARPVAGIVLPENASPAFRPLLALARGLLADYQAQGHDPGVDNTFAPPPAAAWEGLDAKAQRDAVQRSVERAAVDEGLAPDAVACLKVAQGERVILACTDAASRDARPSLLMRLEARLKADLDPSLHVSLEERKDANKLRRL